MQRQWQSNIINVIKYFTIPDFCGESSSILRLNFLHHLANRCVGVATNIIILYVTAIYSKSRYSSRILHRMFLFIRLNHILGAPLIMLLLQLLLPIPFFCKKACPWPLMS